MNTRKSIYISLAALAVTLIVVAPVDASINDSILNRVTAVRTKVNEMLTSLRKGRDEVGSTLQRSIDEALDTARTTVKDEQEGRDDFINSGCTSFKISTIDMLMASQDAVTSALNLAGVNSGLFNTERAQEQIDSAQCRLLYPVYRAVGASIEEAQADITQSANATAAGLDRLKGLLDDATSIECKSNNAAICAVLENRKCGAYVNHAPEIADILDISTKTVTGLRVTGKVADAAGKIGIWKAAVAIWGWFGGDIDFNLPEFLSKTTEAVAEAVEPVVIKQRGQLRSCVDIYAQDRILAQIKRRL